MTGATVYINMHCFNFTLVNFLNKCDTRMTIEHLLRYDQLDPKPEQKCRVCCLCVPRQMSQTTASALY